MDCDGETESPQGVVLGPENLLCHAIYRAGHALTRAYKPLLDPLGLTYPQFLVMTALRAAEVSRAGHAADTGASVGTIGRRVGMDTNTLTPLLKRMARQGLVSRTRDARDERRVIVRLTDAGRALGPQLDAVPARIARETGLSADDLRDLQTRLTALTATLEEG